MSMIERYQERKKEKKRHEREAVLLREIENGLGKKMTTYYSAGNKNILASLCDKYGSDKGSCGAITSVYTWPAHSYTDFYTGLFWARRDTVVNVFECGIGTNNPELPSTMGITGHPGASLRVWRDYFPNATVHGADIDKAILFSEERINTVHMDQCDPASISEAWQEIGENKFDLMVDDGLHQFHAGTVLFENSIDRLSETGIYVIEDVNPMDLIKYKAYFAESNYRVDFIMLQRRKERILTGDNNLVVIRNLEL